MKTKLLLVLALLTVNLWSQEPKAKIKQLAEEIEVYVKTEKENLKNQIEVIDNQQNNGDITKEQAETLKKEATKTATEKMEKVATEKGTEIAALTKTLVWSALQDTTAVDTIDQKFKIEISKDKNTKNKRTTDYLVMAFGINNVLQNNELGSLNDSPYHMWKSNFFELGWSYKTAFSKDSPLWNVRYGASFAWNEFKLFDNKYHIDQNGVTQVAVHAESLKKSKLRHTQLIVPVSLEWDFSKPKFTDGQSHFNRDEAFKFGLGGYAGLRLNTKQIIKYNEPRDTKKDKITNHYNMNNLVYGLMGYIGYKNTNLYVKYDLNPLFKDTETRNISLGFRWDL